MQGKHLERGRLVVGRLGGLLARERRQTGFCLVTSFQPSLGVGWPVPILQLRKPRFHFDSLGHQFSSYSTNLHLGTRLCWLWHSVITEVTGTGCPCGHLTPLDIKSTVGIVFPLLGFELSGTETGASECQQLIANCQSRPAGTAVVLEGPSVGYTAVGPGFEPDL